MHLHIQARNITIQPEWSDLIDSRVARFADRFPELTDADILLRHTRCDVPNPEDVRIVASVPGHTLRATRRGAAMAVTLGSALDALERQLTAYQAARRTFTKSSGLPSGGITAESRIGARTAGAKIFSTRVPSARLA